jgi:hypothetical protein
MPEEFLSYEHDDCQDEDPELEMPSALPSSPPSSSFATHSPGKWFWSQKRTTTSSLGQRPENSATVARQSSRSYGSESLNDDGSSLLSAPKSGRRRQSSSDSKSSGGISETALASLLQSFRWEALLGDQAKLDELWLLARTMLCEEAVRCMVHVSEPRRSLRGPLIGAGWQVQSSGY